MKPIFITPTWPSPTHVKALCTTRHGGYSQKEYASFNLGLSSGDDRQVVQRNRQLLHQYAELPQTPCWLSQIHGNRVVKAEHDGQDQEADASFTQQPNTVCAILTADCLPILLTNQSGSEVAAIHGGWRSLAKGIIGKTVQTLHSNAEQLMAWLGPAIGPDAFEVGEEVRVQFINQLPAAETAFKPSHRTGHWFADIYTLAKQQLMQSGVTRIYCDHWCTHSDSQRFFSYRRDGTTGRMASLVWFVSP